MATDTQHKLGDEVPKIPVFTVLKNGAILKNIFIVDNFDHHHHHHHLDRPTPSDCDQILIVGRHPDCNIMLTHPSISRFHLQILSNPSSHKLSVIDLSSVHGTWVLDKKIDPWARVELYEGDSLRIGGSSRVYRLHWIPLSQAYDIESPYASASDAPLTEEKEEEVSVEAYQDENSLPNGNEPVEEEEKMVAMETNTEEEEIEDKNSLFMENKEIQSLDLVVEGMSSLFSEESLGITVKKEIPSAPPMPKNLINSLFNDGDECIEGSLKDVDEWREISRCYDGPFGTELGQLSSPLECAEFGKDKHILEPSIAAEFVREEESGLAALALEETENQSLFIEDSGQTNKLPLLVGNVVGETENQHDDMKDLDPEALHALESPSLEGKQENSQECHDEVLPASERIEETEDLTLSREHHKLKDVSTEYFAPCMTESLNSSFPAEQVVQEISGDKENQTPQSLYIAKSETRGNSPIRSEKKPGFGSIWSRRGKPANVIQLRMGTSGGETMVDGFNPEYEQQNPENMDDKPISNEVFSCLNGDEEEIFIPDKENFTPNTLQAKSLRKKGKLASVGKLQTGASRVETMLASADSEAEQHNHDTIEDKPLPKEILSCFDGEEEEIFTPDKENLTPNTFLVKSSRKKGKLASVNQLQTSKSRFESMLASADSEGEMYNQERTEEKSISRELFSCLNGEEEEVFTPNKENFTQNTLLLRSLKKKGKLEEVKQSRGCGSSSQRLAFSRSMQPEKDLIAYSNKENRVLRVLQELKPVKQTVSGNQVRPKRELMSNKRRQEIIPFQSLVVNSVGKSGSDTQGCTSATKSSSSVLYSRTVEKVTNPRPSNSIGEVKRSWTMVADATTLLNKESRKSLQLLRGLRGTRLVIPRMVIRELDCLKRRGSVFRRKTEACLVLEWIEQCMVEKSWWIHVQSSAEDGRLTAPTPPASPRSPFSQGSGGFFCGATSSLPFLSHRNLMDIVSPTTEDHILECSLLYQKTMSDGHLVLLSEDVTLKIKAMAEGLICETAQEFRESLMNPFSERFLWVDSSPRGQTWSVTDDVFLREKYNRFPLKKSLKGESAKGLKLILLHNSQYGQRTLIS